MSKVASRARRLTRAFVEALPAKEKRYEVMCPQLPGFGVRVLPVSTRHPRGARVFFIRYRVGGGRSGRARWMRLGRLSEAYGVDQARRDARRLLAIAQDGGDPQGDRAEARLESTFGDFADRYLSEHAVPNKKESSVRMDRINLKLHLLPRLGARKLGSICRADVEDLKRTMGDTPGAANRVLGLLSCMMNLAEQWGVREQNSNPCRGVKRYREKRRDRFLSGEERQRLERVLREAELRRRGQRGYVSPGAVVAIRLLALTGARLGEVLDLEWHMVDFEHGCLRLPDSKTGQKILLLTPQALGYLRVLAEQAPSPTYVAPSDAETRQQNLQSVWRRVRRLAGLEDVNLHALRHSFISDAVQAGVPLHIAGQMAGHKSVQTTQRYAHLTDAVLRDALQRTGDAIATKSRVRIRRVGA